MKEYTYLTDYLEILESEAFSLWLAEEAQQDDGRVPWKDREQLTDALVQDIVRVVDEKKDLRLSVLFI